MIIDPAVLQDIESIGHGWNKEQLKNEEEEDNREDKEGEGGRREEAEAEAEAEAAEKEEAEGEEKEEKDRLTGILQGVVRYRLHIVIQVTGHQWRGVVSTL